MPTVKRASWLFIGALSVAALGVAVLLVMRASAPVTARMPLALVMAAALALTMRFPLPYAHKTRLYLDTSVLLAAVLLLPPGTAMLVAGTGAIAGAVARREEWAQDIFNAAQMMLQVAAGGLVLAAAGWDTGASLNDQPLHLLVIPLAGLAMHLVNTLAVATIVGLQTGRAPLVIWYRSTIVFDRAEFLTHLAQWAIALLVAVICDTHPWALILLVVPAAAMHASLEQHVRIRRRVEEALRGTEANLAEAQRIASLGSWEWNPASGEWLWSDELFRILGLDPASTRATWDAFLGATHPSDRDAVRELVERARRTGAAAGRDCRILRPDGTERTAHVQVEVVAGSDGGASRLVGTVHDITERKQLEERLAYQAFHDALTDLPNRALFTDRLEHALARAARAPWTVAVLFLDLDQFKLVNDTLGHEAGDQLLVSVARRISSCLRPSDTLARLGGDEFTILLEGLADARDAEQVAERITDSLKRPFALGEHQVFVSGSIGIALGGAGVRSHEDLLRNADIALYRAKEAGRARAAVYDAGMGDTTLARVRLEADLRRAIEGGELGIHFQPKVELATGRILGVEALIRWEHPERGLIAPDEFMPVAEEMGLTIPLGRWVLREACRHGRRWQERLARPPVVHVNVSRRQLQQPDLPVDIARVLRETGLAARYLRLEIPESAVMLDPNGVAETLWQLRRLGVQAVIDDFGTSYVNLSRLTRFPVDTLELDRSLVAGIGQGRDGVIAEAVVGLAHALGLAVVAEGVEREDQLAHLRAFGCELGQGNYFSQPVDSREMDLLLGAELGLSGGAEAAGASLARVPAPE